MNTTHKLSLVAAAATLCASSAFAVDVGGIEFHGYSRGGPVLKTSDGVAGGFNPFHYTQLKLSSASP